jgi:hypothetical protein
MGIDSRDRAQYLSLALFAQRVVTALMEYVDDGRRNTLKPSLQEALDSLKGIESKKRAPLAHVRAAAFGSYEHLRTLEEVWDPKERTECIRMIHTLLRSASGESDATRQAERLIVLFSRLQNQALWNFEQPKPVSQTVVQQLCQMAQLT